MYLQDKKSTRYEIQVKLLCACRCFISCGSFFFIFVFFRININKWRQIHNWPARRTTTPRSTRSSTCNVQHTIGVATPLSVANTQISPCLSVVGELSGCVTMAYDEYNARACHTPPLRLLLSLSLCLCCSCHSCCHVVPVAEQGS